LESFSIKDPSFDSLWAQAFAVVEFVFAVDAVLEMPGQFGDAFAKAYGGLYGNIAARNIASVANRWRYDLRSVTWQSSEEGISEIIACD
jgi:hypothetical protein